MVSSRFSSDDRKPVKELAADLPVRLYGDKGYISQAVTDDLAQEGITLVTGQRKNMNAKELSFFDRAMLSKRFIIEAINNQLKNISQIEHSHHRILHGFMLNLLGGLIAYCHKEEKPALNINAGDPISLMPL